MAVCEYKHFDLVSSSTSQTNTSKDFYEVEGDHPAALEFVFGCLDKTAAGASMLTICNLLVFAQMCNFNAHWPELKDWSFA